MCFFFTLIWKKREGNGGARIFFNPPLKMSYPFSNPTAEYRAPDVSHSFSIDPFATHSTSGKTTGPSDYVLGAGAVDRDKPTEHKDTELGHLRAKLTTLQDDINVFLTKRMADSADQITESFPEGEDSSNE